MAFSSSIVITGGFGALGSAIGLAAAEAGARVCLIGHGAPPAAATLPAGVRCIAGVDLTDTQAADAALRQAAEALGGIDALVNVAGGFQWQTVGGDAFDAWDRMYSMNLKTTVVATRAALPWLRARGSNARIVNVGATAALTATAGMGAYAASKAGVLKLTEALAAELADEGINVNAVLPSIIDTPQNRRDMPDADTRNWVRAADLARVVLFLVGPDSVAVTGAALPVTRGPRRPRDVDFSG